MRDTMVAPRSPISDAAATAVPPPSKMAVLIGSTLVLLCVLAVPLSIAPTPQSLFRKQFQTAQHKPSADVPGDVSTQRKVQPMEDGLTMYKQTIDDMKAANEQLHQQVVQLHHDINALTEKYQPDDRAHNTLFTELAASTPDVQDEVVDLIIRKFVASTSTDKRYEKLESAFDVLDFMLTDGEPVQVQDYPFLYVGSVGASLNHMSLMEHNITHVVNWSSSAKCNVWSTIEYRCIYGIHGEDMSKPKNVHILRDAVEFVESARLAGGTVLSHCWYGRNRSVTLLVAYLMTYAGMSINEATHQVAKTRPQADPYKDALKNYERLYLDGMTDETDVNV